MRALVIAAALIVALAALSPRAPATERELTDRGEAEVIGVIDGDTIDVLLTAELAMKFGFPKRKSPLPVRLRLDQVDTPERGQPWGKRAKEALSDLVFGKVVRFQVVDVDRYERAVAQVFLGDVWVNSWLIEQGHGWAYRRYAEQAALLCSLEDKARKAGRGLWSQPQNSWQPPWLWRKHSSGESFAPSLAECLAAADAKPRR